MKKKIIIITGVIISLITIFASLYFYGLTPANKKGKEVEFEVKEGSGKLDIVNDLKEAHLIKSKLSLYVYLTLNHKLNLQAGNYHLSSRMSAKEIVSKIVPYFDYNSNNNIHNSRVSKTISSHR